MIQANEIRIGNYINHNNTFLNPLMRVDPFLWQDNICPDETFQEFDPIPLTHQTLEKCGFELIGMEWQTTKSEFTECFEFKENRLHYTGGEGVKYGIGCQYLHQLQNLYFALTGAELQINL